ncbi:jg21249 [Pararge aegeria aegeria]|uniref:Jg21249 protein n=1 Tax=Pararge aegeria aegeria TaxID=348720 RepID=A0A8S4RGZ1_9NEOP|nr:jg21249 [Pararge aegeria aegeria]
MVCNVILRVAPEHWITWRYVFVGKEVTRPNDHDQSLPPDQTRDNSEIINSQNLKNPKAQKKVLRPAFDVHIPTTPDRTQ